jgi:glycosyltransferase involved in cell wall biosynthesis
MSVPLHNDTLKAIQAKLGRPLRVLHIGNIANNAYNNARIQRQYGIEADVISYDYYHVMSTPEWEDAEFEGEVDANAPNWWGTSLKGWKRPDWFVQGPADACIQYLKARHLGHDRLASLLWRYLEARSLGHVRHLQKAAGKPLTPLSWSQKKAILLSEALGVHRTPRKEAFGPRGAAPSALGAELVKAPPRNAGSRIRNALRPAVRAVMAAYSATKAASVILVRGFAGTAMRVAAFPFALGHFAQARHLQRSQDALALAARDKDFGARLARLEADCAALPQDDQARVRDYALRHPRRFFRLLRDYDIVQAYSLDGFIPFMNGLPSYAAYEHGTLRDLPFQQTFYGALTRAAYAEASVIFITNSDVPPITRRLGLDEKRLLCLPHAFDDRKLADFRNAHPEIRPPAGPATFFSPTRHHWNDTSGSWTKGNDVLLRAAGRLAADGFDFRLVLVEWGQEIAASKALIAELGIEDKVTWVPTMRKHELWQAYCQAHAVADQFTLPALGGVGFETMALGRRLITAIDEQQLAHFFGEAPPCLGAQTIEDCVRRMRQVILDPEDDERLGEAGQHWMAACHSAQRIVAIQLDAYRKLLIP